MGEAPARSPWFYVAVGCGGVLFVLVVVVGVLIWFGARTIRSISEEMSDPQARRGTALKLLGAQELPAGYYTGPALSVPLLFDLVVLGDAPPGPDGQIPDEAEHQFLYMRMFRGGREWKRYVEGEGDPFDVLDQGGFRIDRGPSIARAELKVGSQEIAFVSERGGFRSDHGGAEGLLSLMFIRCPEDRRMRVAVWTGPDPDPHTPVDQVDFAGTTADPAEAERFMAAFDTCGGQGAAGATL